MLRVDEGLSRSLIVGISKYSKDSVSVSDMAGRYPILAKEFIHSGYGENRWEPTLKKVVTDGFHEPEAFASGRARASKTLDKMEVLATTTDPATKKTLTWKKANNVEGFDEISGRWNPKVDNKLNPGGSTLWAEQLTKEEKADIKMKVWEIAKSNVSKFRPKDSIIGQTLGYIDGDIYLEGVSQIIGNKKLVFGVFYDNAKLEPISIFPKFVSNN